jgi:sporulation-control protein
MALKSFLRAFGVGGAEIDAVLDNDRVQPGGTISGTLHIRGGEASQTASRAVLELAARVTRKMGDHEVQADEVIAGLELTGPIPLGQPHALPFRLEVPTHTPVTAYGGRNFVWLRSGLDVPWAVDPSDTDRLDIVPTPEQANVIDAMESLGFRLYKVDIEPRSSWFGRRWVQEFEFRPVSRGNYRFDEIEIVFESQRGSQVEVLMQIDRAARGLGGLLMEMTGTDESWRRAVLDASSRQAAAASLQRAIG